MGESVNYTSASHEFDKAFLPFPKMVKILSTLKVLKRWKHFDYNVLLYTLIPTGVPYHLKCVQNIYRFIWDFSLRALTIANLYVIFEEHFYNRLIHASILRYIAQLLSCQSEGNRGEKQLSTFKQKTHQSKLTNRTQSYFCKSILYVTI